jgi:antitoxin component of MazEF toxin-antitoxin module
VTEIPAKPDKTFQAGVPSRERRFFCGLKNPFAFPEPCNYSIPMNAIQKPVRIGNSKGVRIPAHLVRTYHLERGFVMRPVQEGILIAPANDEKLSLEESFAAMADDQSDMKITRDWAESGLSDGLEEED